MTGGLVELQGPARRAVFVGPQPRLEGLEELEPGRLLVALVVSFVDQREVVGLLHFEEKRVAFENGCVADAASGLVGFAGGPWDETAGFARSPHKRLRVPYAVPFGRLTT